MAEIVQVEIKGMHCKSCETMIKEELSELSGVNPLSINYKTGRGIIEVENEKSSHKAIIQAIKKAGYEAQIVSDDKKNNEIIPNNAQVFQSVKEGGKVLQFTVSIDLGNFISNSLSSLIKPSLPVSEKQQTIMEEANNYHNAKDKPDVNKRVSIAVSGMHCASCASLIERSLKKVPGVREANVNYATEKASVLYNGLEAGEDELVKAVEKAGYKGELVNKLDSNYETQRKKPGN